ncbi:MAG: SDR family NAD(P)-dependent oxidoreductase [Nocardiopsaceae bacterium]|nr:SDR family NAD(P)-dependent oxidoreductase [Nocardiopsaceae bacterium]
MTEPGRQREPGRRRESVRHDDLIGAGRVAVVTGAASGIGLGLARRFAAEGMRVVLADVEEPALEAAASRLAETGARVLAHPADVSSAAQVDALRDATLSAFGAVHVVCSNAGVGGPHGPLWECTPGEWDWVLGVNLGGVINGVRAFMPVLLEQDAGHLVNTASIFGVFAGALGPYGVSKHAVVALTETLHFNLESADVSHVGVSVLCPGAVRTNFGTSARNRPAWAGPPLAPSPEEQAAAERFDRLSAQGASPDEVADIVVSGIRRRRFYILTSQNRNEAVIRRGTEIVSGGPPAAPFP